MNYNEVEATWDILQGMLYPMKTLPIKDWKLVTEKKLKIWMGHY